MRKNDTQRNGTDQKEYQYQKNNQNLERNQDEILNDIEPSFRSLDKSNKKNEDFMVIEQCLGVGAYGQVQLVKDVNTRIHFARKIINKERLTSIISRENLKREIRIQKKLSHPNVLKLSYYYEDRDNVYLILEYAEMGSLQQLIQRRKRLSEREAFLYFQQIVLGLEYIHRMKVVHRDIKLDNLVYTNNGDVKICDFGWAVEMPCNSNVLCGTIEYMAPEMVQNQQTDFPIDLWSLGIVLYELVQGKPPFSKGTVLDKNQKNNIFQNIQYEHTVSDECKNLIFNLLQYNPRKRLSFDKIKNHQWMMQQGKNQFSIRSSSMITLKSTHFNSEILESQQRVNQIYAEKSSVKEWEAMKFRSQQFQFARIDQQQQQQQQNKYQDKGFLVKALIALGCINR